jgi:hypothetical protein
MGCPACNEKTEDNVDVSQLFTVPLSSHTPGKLDNITQYIVKNIEEEAKKSENEIINTNNIIQPTPPPTLNIQKPLPTPVSTHTLPSKKEMAFGLTQNIKNALSNLVMKGSVLAPRGVVDKRMETCLSCEFLIHDQSRCSKCGCFMNVKARLEVAKCPLNKW